MWSNSSGVNNISSSKAISSSSLLSTSSSSTWTKSSSSPIPTTTRKSMEEVWEDITQSSLHHYPTTAFHGMILQDFLARTLNEDPLTTRVDYYSRQPSSAGGGGAPPRPTNVMSLTSSADHLMRASNPQLKDGGSSVGMASFKSPSDSSFSKKRPPENGHNSIDRKDKRLIKNRESAERSRARKQAYIYELEQEVTHLVEENAKLRKELHKRSCLAETAPPQLPKKQSLTRSLTAPF